MKTLDNALYAKITALCEEGDVFVNSEDIRQGLAKYHEAWTLLPEPKEDWEAVTWILSAIGDAHYLSNDYEHAISALKNAILCPDGLGNAFIHLRLGECFFEIGDIQKAQDNLTRAYMGAGKDIFDNEDPKYFNCLREVLNSPIDPELI